MNKLSMPTIVLHEKIIRLARGMLSAWEDWLNTHK